MNMDFFKMAMEFLKFLLEILLDKKWTMKEYTFSRICVTCFIFALVMILLICSYVFRPLS